MNGRQDTNLISYCPPFLWKGYIGHTYNIYFIGYDKLDPKNHT